MKPWTPSDPSLYDGPASLSDVFPHFGLHHESPPTYSHSSKYPLFKVSPVGIHSTCSNAFCGAFLPIWVSKVLVWHHSHHVIAYFWTRQSRLSLFFPSCFHLLDCDDNCMLSVPLSTSDLHYCRWQSGEICQVLSTGAFTLFCHVFMVSMKVCSLSFFLVLPRRLSARCLLSYRPDTASIRSCLLLPPGFLDTREAGI